MKTHKSFAGIVEGYVYFVKINTLEKNNFALDPFGRQLDAHKQVAEWKKIAKNIHVSLKHQPNAWKTTVLREIAAIGATEWYVRFKQPTNFYSDHSIQLFYKK